MVWCKLGWSGSAVEFSFCENVGLGIAGPRPTNLMAFYRSPNSESRNDSSHADLLRGVLASCECAFRFGYLNGAKSDWDTFSGPSEFAPLLRVLREFSLSPVVDGPTRIREGQLASLLDGPFLRNTLLLIPH